MFLAKVNNVNFQENYVEFLHVGFQQATPPQIPFVQNKRGEANSLAWNVRIKNHKEQFPTTNTN